MRSAASLKLPKFARDRRFNVSKPFSLGDRWRHMMTDPKEVLEIPKDNAIFGGSFATFEKFGYSPAVRAGGLLFIAGVVGARPDGSVPDSVGEQAELAFQRTAGILRLEPLFGQVAYRPTNEGP